MATQDVQDAGVSDEDEIREQLDALEGELRAIQSGIDVRGIRRRSEMTIGGLLLYEIAIGPDLERQEVRGHARGFLAVGDIATGVVAFGGLARGLIAVGGLALGCVSLGGCSLGLLFALGGFALGGIAVGGAAIGLVAIGGGALGYYACGGGAFGNFVVSAIRQDPEAIQFFSDWIPGAARFLPGPGD